MGDTAGDAEEEETQEVFCLELPDGDFEALRRFLCASYLFLHHRKNPPSLSEFKHFLEGGHFEITDKSEIAATSCTTTEYCPEKRELIELLVSQHEALTTLAAESDGEVNDALALGSMTSAGEWKNFTLYSFTDIACEVSEFKIGHYDQTWEWIKCFYEYGQVEE